MGFSWQLINDSITDSDKKALTDFINTPNQRFTQGEKVREFEYKFAQHMGSKYSVMVNSGSSANLLMIAALVLDKNIDLNEGDEVIVPTLSWATTYYPLQQYRLKSKFVDIFISFI